MAGLVLEEAAPLHQQRAMEYRREFLAAGERHINGSCELGKYTDYREWLRAVDAFLDEKTSPWGITATTYFTVRKSDGRIVGTLQLRHSLRGDTRMRRCTLVGGIQRDFSYGDTDLLD